MSTPRFQRSWVLWAFGFLSLLCVQSCVSNGLESNILPCPIHVSAQEGVYPCDIYDAAGTACVAAFSTARALYGSYSGPLYQVVRKSDKTTANIGVLSDGYANASVQDEFCANTTCTIAKIFDQSPHHNDLAIAPPGVSRSGEGPGGDDLPARADSLPITAGGHKVYGVLMSAGMGYRDDDTVGIAVDGQPEGVYMVNSGTRFNNGCCFDFGNAEKNNHDNGPGHMDAIRFLCDTPCKPEVGFDMENGTYPFPRFPVLTGIPFVTAMGSNNGQSHYVLYWGNAQDACLATTGSLALPKGYSPMHQEGAIILGIGGDNSNWSQGAFFEGAMTAGTPSSATMLAVQANVASVGYAAATNP